jgi:putative transposase
MVTAGTYKKTCLFRENQQLSRLTNELLTLAERYGWELQAWAAFANHYHFIAQSLRPENLRRFISHFHTATAAWINKSDGTPGRKVWFQYWESRITFQRSFLARLNYVHQNAVHHRLVLKASEYPWCSASWLEQKADRSFVRMVSSFPCDKLKIPDDYAVDLDGWGRMEWSV